MSELIGLRDDVYRRPLATALERLGLGPGWRCVDVGAGGGDVSVALAEIVGRDGRVYAVDSDPLARDEVARAAAASPGASPSPRPARTCPCPSRSTWRSAASCSCTCSTRPWSSRRCAAVRPGGWVVAQEPDHHRRSHRRGAAVHARTPATPTSAPCCPRWSSDAGLDMVDAWAEAPAGVGPGPVADYLESLTEVDPGDDPVVLPPW